MIEVLKHGIRYEIQCEYCKAELRFNDGDTHTQGTSKYIFCPECRKAICVDKAKRSGGYIGEGGVVIKA